MPARLLRIDAPFRHLAVAALLVASAVGSLGCGKYFVSARPATASATEAPPFALPDANGNTVSLDSLLAARRPVVLVFYRGYW